MANKKKRIRQTEKKPALPAEQKFNKNYMVGYQVLGRNALAAYVSLPVYFTFLGDHIYTRMTHHHILPRPDFIDKDTYFGQGADFFCPPAYAMAIGQPLTYKAYRLVDSISEKAGEKFIENWRTIRSCITLGLFAGIETFQSVAGRKDFDTKDMLAYTAGLAFFMHTMDIAKAGYETATFLGAQANKLVGKALGIRQDTLTS